MKVALITGITGQDGSYLAEFLLEKGYEVHGIIRRSSMINTYRIDHIFQNIKLHYGDLTDSTNIVRVIQKVQPDEIYNLGAQSHVKVSFEMPEYTADVDGMGTLRVLEAVRLLGMEDRVRIYQASTSELYGLVQEVPQRETTPFYPRSPYGVAKLYAYWITKNYREAYGMYACTGILFNHESPRRGETFVTRKITKGFKALSEEKQTVLMAAPYFGMNIEWQFTDKGTEIGIDTNTGLVRIMVDPKYFRPAEVDSLLGDYTKAKQKLGWEPKISFEQLVEDMCTNEKQF